MTLPAKYYLQQSEMQRPIKLNQSVLPSMLSLLTNSKGTLKEVLVFQLPVRCLSITNIIRLTIECSSKFEDYDQSFTF